MVQPGIFRDQAEANKQEKHSVKNRMKPGDRDGNGPEIIEWDLKDRQTVSESRP